MCITCQFHVLLSLISIGFSRILEIRFPFAEENIPEVYSANRKLDLAFLGSLFPAQMAVLR